MFYNAKILYKESIFYPRLCDLDMREGGGCTTLKLKMPCLIIANMSVFSRFFFTCFLTLNPFIVEWLPPLRKQTPESGGSAASTASSTLCGNQT